MNYEPRKSKYGKEITFLFEPEYLLPLNKLLIKEVPSTFNPSEELLKEIKDKWKAANMELNGDMRRINSLLMKGY